MIAQKGFCGYCFNLITVIKGKLCFCKCGKQYYLNFEDEIKERIIYERQ